MALPPNLVTDILAALERASADGPFWSVNSEQLNVNLLRLSLGQGIPEHVNDELDVLLAVFGGRGELTINDELHLVSSGSVTVVPRGARRSLRCIEAPLVYLSAHRQRGGLMPR